MINLLIAFELGTFLYGIIEILWRGYTHWTMMLLGGICMTMFYIFNLRYWQLKLLQKCTVGALVITILEFLTGCIVNIGLGWNIWDYSNIPFNLYGQVCLKYVFLWGIISIPMIFISDKIKIYR